MLAFLETENKFTGMPIFTSSRTSMSYHHAHLRKTSEEVLSKDEREEK